MRQVLLAYEPLLARTLSDSLLAAWLAGSSTAGQAVSSPAPAPASQPSLGIPAPPQGYAVAGQADEPIVRFPLIEEAYRDLSRRGVLTRQDFDGLHLDAQRAAFTVARISSLDALEKIQTALGENIRTGGTLRDFASTVEAALGTSALAPHHVETIYRTNLATAYTSGLMRTLEHPLVADEFPYLAYHAVHDARARKDHLALEKHGIGGSAIYRRDDPIWQRFTPPWDFNCRCMVVPLSLEDAAQQGVVEAQKWLESGTPPAHPAWVAMPDFAPPHGFRGPGRRLEARI